MGRKHSSHSVIGLSVAGPRTVLSSVYQRASTRVSRRVCQRNVVGGVGAVHPVVQVALEELDEGAAFLEVEDAVVVEFFRPGGGVVDDDGVVPELFEDRVARLHGGEEDG